MVEGYTEIFWKPHNTRCYRHVIKYRRFPMNFHLITINYSHILHLYYSHSHNSCTSIEVYIFSFLWVGFQRKLEVPKHFAATVIGDFFIIVFTFVLPLPLITTFIVLGSLNLNETMDLRYMVEKKRIAEIFLLSLVLQKKIILVASGLFPCVCKIYTCHL